MLFLVYSRRVLDRNKVPFEHRFNAAQEATSGNTYRT